MKLLMLRPVMNEKANSAAVMAMIHKIARHTALSKRSVGPTASTWLRLRCARAAMSAEIIEATAEMIATMMLVSIRKVSFFLVPATQGAGEQILALSLGRSDTRIYFGSRNAASTYLHPGKLRPYGSLARQKWSLSLRVE
jgi:hypothetical protein